MKDPANLMLSARNKYVLVACFRGFPYLEDILTDDRENVHYRELFNTEKDMLNAANNHCFDDYGVGLFYINHLGHICSVGCNNAILYKRYIDYYVRTYKDSWYSEVYNKYGKHIGTHYHKLIQFYDNFQTKKGYLFIKQKPYPIFKYQDFVNKKPDVLHIEHVRTLTLTDLEGHKIIMRGFVPNIYNNNQFGSSINLETQKAGIIINTLTEALGGIK